VGCCSCGLLLLQLPAVCRRLLATAACSSLLPIPPRAPTGRPVLSASVL